MTSIISRKISVDFTFDSGDVFRDTEVITDMIQFQSKWFTIFCCSFV